MNNFLNNFQGVLNSFTISDFIDVFIVAYIIFYLTRFIRETRAFQLIKGIFILVAIYSIAVWLHFKTLSFLIRYIFQYGAFALLIVLQPELRSSLEKLGHRRLNIISLFTPMDKENETTNNYINAIVDACNELSNAKIGALIVIENETKLGEIIKSGTIIDSQISKELIESLFFPNSSLHDGAVIIRDGRLYAAGCYLPLSSNYTISKDYGTRHRAALGMSENSDALVIVISEEKGTITIAKGAKLDKNISLEKLKSEIYNSISIQNDKIDINTFINKVIVKK